MTRTVLSIAGLDPSGGAGISADLKTSTVMGTYGMAALTTVTVQHPGAVDRVAPLPPEIVAEQVATVLAEMPINAIKVGMLGSTEIAEALTPLLAQAQAPMVMDPVRISTSGTPLGHVDSTAMDPLIDLASLITPNDDELEAILGDTPPGRWATERGVAVLHTGGHGRHHTIQDVLWLPDGTHRRWSHSRTDTPHTHGSGCTLSTAVAAGLARGLGLPDAVAAAIHYTSRLIMRSADQHLVATNGPLLHFKPDE